MEQELYPFTNGSEKDLFNKISKELRCTVCQNQSLFDSKAPVALNLRQEIYQLIRGGKQEQEIVDTVVSRYGDTILYRPSFKADTYILWGGPVLMVLMGCLFLRKLFR